MNLQFACSGWPGSASSNRPTLFLSCSVRTIAVAQVACRAFVLCVAIVTRLACPLGHVDLFFEPTSTRPVPYWNVGTGGEGRGRKNDAGST